MEDATFLMEMGKRIAARRRELHLTQEQTAEKMDVSLQTVSCIELGKKAIRPQNLAKLCAVLNTSADYVLFGKRTEQELADLSQSLAALSERDYNTVKALVKHLQNENA
ncbi:MAG: helix-turn-helix transcriptional regulator [Clostridia bacterium]|nr:helix-turn-helix transcriptional regulator [Clostridia bacterium]